LSVSRCAVASGGGGAAQAQTAKASEENPEVSTSQILPKTFALERNYSNPFNPETMIRFQLPEASHVVLKIFNILGQEARTPVNQQSVCRIQVGGLGCKK